MRSYQIIHWGQPLQLTQRDTPVPRGAEVLVRVQACGVCHSDVHIWDGSFDLGDGRRLALADVGATLPFTMGHEIVGEVAAAGPDAHAAVGAPCVVYPWIGCGLCEACLSGRELDCAAMVSLGTRRAGGYSDHVLVPHSRYVLDYGRLDPHLAATCACSGLTAYSALRKLPECQARDAVLIIGAGGLGLAAVGLARVLSPARIFVADVDPRKLDVAREMGVAGVVDLRAPDALAQLNAQTQRAPRAVIDFVGSAATVGFSIQSAAKGGTVVVVGLFGGSLPLSTALLPLRNLTLQGSYVGTLAQMHELLALAQTQPIASVPLSVRPMHEINEVLTALREGRVVGRVVAAVA
jgi:D-arabinose 1-dehydrogenase-like Zn-dependent alcohol dehydrogenase